MPPSPPPSLSSAQKNSDAWEEIIGRCEEVGVDAFEINFSCPHGEGAAGGSVCVCAGVSRASWFGQRGDRADAEEMISLCCVSAWEGCLNTPTLFSLSLLQHTPLS